MKNIKCVGKIFLAIILIVNLPPAHSFIEFGQLYCYTTRYGDQLCEKVSFGPCFAEIYATLWVTPEKANACDKKVYRMFRKNMLYFWRWSDYFYHPRYQLPYLAPEQVLPYPSNWPDSLKTHK